MQTRSWQPTEAQTEHQNKDKMRMEDEGDLFQQLLLIHWQFHITSPPSLVEQQDPGSGRVLVGSSCVVQKALLVSGVRGQKERTGQRP